MATDHHGRIGGWRGTVPALIFVAIATRILAAIGLAVIPRDGTSLVRLARAVAAGNPGAAFHDTQHPLYPLVAGGLGGSETAATAVAIVAGSLAVIPILFIGTRLHSRAAGLIAALLYAVAPGVVRYECAPLAEGLYIVLFLFAVERALATPRPFTALAAGLLAGAAYLTRPEALTLVLVLPAGMFLRRRWVPAVLMIAGFAALAAPYIMMMSREADRLVLSRKKPVARFVRAEAGFDAHMEEKSKRTRLSRPGVGAATVDLLRTLGEALSWVLLPAALAGAFLLLRIKGRRGATLLILALLGIDLLLRFRLLHLHGYLGRRHLVTALVLCLPLAGAGLMLTLKRRAIVVAGVLAGVFLLLAVRPRDAEKAPLLEAGRWILAQAGEGARVATWLTPRIPYYAVGEDLKLQRAFPDLRTEAGDAGEIRAWFSREADWVALAPAQLPKEAGPALLLAGGEPARAFGSGDWRILVYRVGR